MIQQPASRHQGALNVNQYDADNRLTHTYTSEDGYLWECDARYFYYPHGPLMRCEKGADQVQGEDYYYTLQGWIKGVNNTTGATESRGEVHFSVVLLKSKDGKRVEKISQKRGQSDPEVVDRDFNKRYEETGVREDDTQFYKKDKDENE